ncbi:MAG: cytochrome c oxidase assembly protein [Bryobacteraceae bacterium]
MFSEVHGDPPIFVTVALIAAVLVYLRGWYRLRSDLPNVLPRWRLAAFMGGLFSLWVAVGSPLATLDHQLLTAHMAQHLILMTVAAPLLLLGAPAITLLHGLPQRFAGRVLGPLLRTPAVKGFGRVVSHPVFCWIAATATVIGWHGPALFDMAMRSERWHAVEHAWFFAAGILFWWPVVQPWPSLARWPRWSVPLYLFLATLPCDALSAFLAFCGRVVYPHYLSAHRLFDISPLADQECAGALMWVWVTFAYLGPAAFVTVQLLSPQRRAFDVEVV